MKHSIREHIIDPVRGKIVKVSTINAELGSGLVDKNGKEIFEGDIVKYEYEIYTVIFDDGGFGFTSGGDDSYELYLYAKEIEIVGHAED